MSTSCVAAMSSSSAPAPPSLSSPSPSSFDFSPAFPALRPRFLGGSVSSTAPSSLPGVYAVGVSKASGWLLTSADTKFKAVALACCKGRGIAPWNDVRRSCVISNAGNTARITALATRRVSSRPPARATKPTRPMEACRATASSTGFDTKTANSSIAKAAASAEEPRPRFEQKDETFASKSRATWDETDDPSFSPSTSLSSASAASSPPAASAFFSRFCLRSPRRSPRRERMICRKTTG
mmetsp:Transcript_90793/g.228336  ORF Transcript_90793/g.228336 Transcript_90793/m.228336 type:complete len:239 (+) Transcript_90793:3710-4426(+)